MKIVMNTCMFGLNCQLKDFNVFSPFYKKSVVAIGENGSTAMIYPRSTLLSAGALCKPDPVQLWYDRSKVKYIVSL